MRSYKYLTLDRRDKVLTVTINNPPTNQLTDLIDCELADLFHDLSSDSTFNVLVLAASGDRMFCGGGDLDDMIAMTEDVGLLRWSRRTAVSRRILLGMLDLPVPIIARVQGHAIGIGATLAVYSDIVFAAEHVKIGDPHVQVGLTAGDGATIAWPQLIGLARSRYFLLTGDTMTATQAVAIGLIHKAVPLAQLDEAVYGLADRFAAMSRVALTTTKRAINIPMLREFVASIEATLGLETQSLLSSEHKKALLALKEKRDRKQE